MVCRWLSSDVSWMCRYLIITFPKINLAEDLATGNPGRKIQHVGKRVHVRLRDQVKAAVPRRLFFAALQKIAIT
jgi:hypothetical protein